VIFILSYVSYLVSINTTFVNHDLALSVLSPSENRSELDQVKSSKIVPFDFIRPNSVAFAK